MVKNATSLEQVTPAMEVSDRAAGGGGGTLPVIRSGRSPAAQAGAPPAAWIAERAGNWLRIGRQQPFRLTLR